ncbi:p-hydroxyphenylacetate 3-hydroxylase reductase component [Granulosicoccus antarcticus]|uniref:p-hydroxyphenylacetate 3-hydroxylase, reductase component n=1 Tax=Granulosicoccus antarcticus IMCC3135 TaxID=1192854 RepID=A0A2Z2NMY4_9GAMM|nr:flavin reductase [Granulosicoccus antarcticus]ASJ72746.1 p-hydroxyphenylacetate 3-hydroxylase, reductase component [Granulosicoccus antarcticus IMCC3135]
MTTTKIHDEIDPKAFRRALGNFATGVTIITTRAADGSNVGVTASSFNSLSMDPPLILWSSIKETPSCKVFESASHFAVNILASDQMEMSNHFARQQEDKFEGVQWEEGLGGAPIFPDCAGRFQCESYDKLDGGDHWIFVGKVVKFDDFGRSPLCFHQGSYSMVFSHPETYPNAGQNESDNADQGRLGNHAFFLMLRAVRAYQERYRPKLVTLGLNLIESRVLLVLNDFPGLGAEGLVVHLHTPMTEAREALLSLCDRGLVAVKGEGYVLTSSGQSKTDECWNLAEAHAKETFERFSSAEVDTFTDILRQLISQ